MQHSKCNHSLCAGELQHMMKLLLPQSFEFRRARLVERVKLAAMIVGATLIVSLPVAAGAASNLVGRFTGGLEPWREIQFNADLKRNTFRIREWDGAAALEVVSSASMSVLGRPLSVDLAATPILCWRWRIDAPLERADMTQRSGDDYAARLYVSLKIPDAEIGFALRTKLKLARAIWGPDVPDAAINYVWDNRQPVGAEMPNAYTDRTIMVVQRSGKKDAGQWQSERRNVQQDAARLFGPSARPVQLAITSDTDNTGESARAGFADIRFVSPDQGCN